MYSCLVFPPSRHRVKSGFIDRPPTDDLTTRKANLFYFVAVCGHFTRGIFLEPFLGREDAKPHAIFAVDPIESESALLWHFFFNTRFHFDFVKTGVAAVNRSLSVP